MKKIIQQYCIIVFILWSRLVHADLPRPPSRMIADSNQDFVQIGTNLMRDVVNIAIPVSAVVLLISIVGMFIKAYRQYQQEGELGIVGKSVLVGLVIASLGLALLYLAYKIFQ